MKHRRPCPYCDRVFEAEGELKHVKGRLNANLTNHIKGAHPKAYKPSKLVLDRNRRAEKKLDPIKPQILISGPDPEEPKRKWTRKPQTQSSVCYCPKCGCNIRAVQVAMDIA